MSNRMIAGLDDRRSDLDGVDTCSIPPGNNVRTYQYHDVDPAIPWISDVYDAARDIPVAQSLLTHERPESSSAPSLFGAHYDSGLRTSRWE